MLFGRRRNLGSAGRRQRVGGRVAEGSIGWAQVEFLEPRTLLTLTGAGTTVAAVRGEILTAPLARFTADPPGTAADFVATINWGDGVIDTGTIEPVDGGGYQVLGTHAYNTEGVKPVEVTIRRTFSSDDPLELDSSVVVSAPRLTGSGTTVFGQVGVPVTATLATFNAPFDAGPADFVATIAWGDDTTGPGAIEALPGGGFRVIGSHTYTTQGEKPVSVTVRRALSTDDPLELNSSVIVASPELTGSGTTSFGQVGVPVTATVATFNAPFEAGPADFVATIDWGDGTTGPGAIEQLPGGGFQVVGTHTYASLGNKPVTVSVNRVGGGSPELTINSAISVAARAFSGGLDPASDTGASNTDGITRINQPTLSGTAEPFALVQIAGQRSDQLAPVALGATVADASGAWRLQLGLLADGEYTLSAMITSSTGASISQEVLQPMVIDTVAPRIVALGYDPRAGRVLVTFQDDRTGMDLDSIRTARNYNLIGRIMRRLASESTPDLVTSEIVSTDPQAVVVSVAAPGRRPHPRNLRVLSGGVADQAGNPLDGEFQGRLPTGNGQPGGDFVGPITLGNVFHRFRLGNLLPGAFSRPRP